MLFLNHKELKTENLYNYNEIVIEVKNEDLLNANFNNLNTIVESLEAKFEEELNKVESNALVVVKIIDQEEIDRLDYLFYSSIVLSKATGEEGLRDYWVIPRKNNLNEKVFCSEVPFIKFINSYSRLNRINIIVLGTNGNGFSLVNKGQKVEREVSYFDTSKI